MIRDVPLLVGSRTDTGLVREANEDSMLYVRSGDRHVFVVADGMGGEVGGALASQKAVEAAEETFSNNPWRSPSALLKGAVAAANRACRELRATGRGLERLGTTLDVVLVDRDTVWWAHVGDGRIYRLHNGTMHQLTHDHSAVERMVREGLIGPGEAADHPRRHVLEKALGPSAQLVPDVASDPLVLEEGDSIILCTDGLTDVVTPGEIAEAIAESGPQLACDRLVGLAKARGGADNVTVQVVHRGSGSAAWKAPSAAGCRKRSRRSVRLALVVAVLVLILVTVLVLLSTSGRRGERDPRTGGPPSPEPERVLRSSH